LNAGYQARDAHKRLIMQNQSVIEWSIYPTKDNGFGTQVPDTTKTPTVKKEYARLSHESAGVSADGTTPVGLDTSFSMFIELFHDTALTAGSVITANGEKWTVGAVDTMRHSGIITGKRAPLVSA
jgi:hypothetical protein